MEPSNPLSFSIMISMFDESISGTVPLKLALESTSKYDKEDAFSKHDGMEPLNDVLSIEIQYKSELHNPEGIVP